jgi:transposase
VDKKVESTVADAPEVVTMPAPREGVEDVVVGQERWEQMHRLKAEGMTVSGIARATELDRKTVRRCLRQVRWQAYRRAVKREGLMAAHRSWLEGRAPQVGYSARILYQELCAQRGFEGGYGTVRDAVRPLRIESAAALVTQRRFETEPGEQAQADWGEVRVRLGAQIVKVHIFVLTLGYSRRAWCEGYEHERMESLLCAHEHAFEHFGGVTREILYDRMRTVIVGEREGSKRWNPTFEAFAQHWGFEPRVCQPYRAQTKGKVESGVKYVKRNFLPGRVFRDLDDFNEQLRAWQAEIADVRVHGTTHQLPIERFAREANALTPLANRAGFLAAMPRKRVVASDWLVAIDTNRYSVPWRLIGTMVEVFRVGGHWQIRHQGAVVAEHAVCEGRYQLRVNPEHGPGAVARNARLRYADTAALQDVREHAAHEPFAIVEQRDLTVYGHSDWTYCFARFIQPYQPSPIWQSGRPAHRPFRGLLGVHSRYGLYTRAVTVFRDTLNRRLKSFRYLHDFSDCFRPEQVAGWDSHPLEKRRLITAHAKSGRSMD